MSSAKKPESRGFTEEEKAAVRERVRELKAGEKDGEKVVLDKLVAMPAADRVPDEKLHTIRIIAFDAEGARISARVKRVVS